MHNSVNVSSGFSGIDIPSDDTITNCMHCGLCLPTCPTFSITGREKSSPRGRIRLIKAVAEGKLEITQGFIEEMNFCLDCQACETACPAGVKYGSLVEAARNQIRVAGKESVFTQLVKNFFLRKVLSQKRSLRTVARILWFYQNSGLERLINAGGVMKFLAPKLSELQKLSPRVDRTFFSDRSPEIIKPNGSVRYRVGFLTGCIMDVAFAGINDDTLKVLLHHQCEVVIPHKQQCCGSLQAHNGDFEIARTLARQNIDIFAAYDLDAIIMNSAGCGAMMKEYGHYLTQDPQYARPALELSRKIKDLSEFLYEIGLKEPSQEFRHSVSYHDACHLAHSQKVTKEPRDLIRSIPGVQFVELNEASWCCGSAGIYNVVQYDDSMKILERKMANVEIARADYLVANNPGCLLQIGHGIKKNRLNTEIVHLATLLRKVYQL